MIEQDMSSTGHLIDWIKRHPALRDLLGDRVYPDQAPEDVKPPYAVTREAGDEPEQASDGYGGVTRFDIEFEIYAQTRQQTVSIAKAFSRNLNTYQGRMGSIHCQLATAQGGASDYLPDVELHVKTVDITLTYSER